MRPCGMSTERPNQAADDGGLTGMATTAAQASGQQSAVCKPSRQQCLCEVME